jgi:hypothetical protein
MDKREKKKKEKEEIYDEDFEQHYSEPEYDEDDEQQASTNSVKVFGVTWDSVDQALIGNSISVLLAKAKKYKEDYIDKGEEGGDAAKEALGAIKLSVYIVNIAIFFKVDKGSHKSFYAKTDEVNQRLAQE